MAVEDCLLILHHLYQDTDEQTGFDDNSESLHTQTHVLSELENTQWQGGA